MIIKVKMDIINNKCHHMENKNKNHKNKDINHNTLNSECREEQQIN